MLVRSYLISAPTSSHVPSSGRCRAEWGASSVSCIFIFTFIYLFIYFYELSRSYQFGPGGGFFCVCVCAGRKTGQVVELSVGAWAGASQTDIRAK